SAPAQPGADRTGPVTPATDGGDGRIFHFGTDARRLFGMRHGAPSPRAGGKPLLVPSPMLQEGVACQRALWMLCEAIAARGGPGMRFDWYGTGESAGDALDVEWHGMQDDLHQAIRHLDASGTGVRILAFRSAGLPVLAAATAQARPVDLVLWDPVLRGDRMLDEWKRQHRVQLTAAGRYLREGRAVARADELLGFDVPPALLDAIGGLDFRSLALPAGSRVQVIEWAGEAPDTDAMVETLQGAGVTVERVALAADDRPTWDDPARFEAQVFPRRSVREVASLIEGKQA